MVACCFVMGVWGILRGGYSLKANLVVVIVCFSLFVAPESRDDGEADGRDLMNDTMMPTLPIRLELPGFSASGFPARSSLPWC